jgi:dTDP-4-dehydrorhamnose 3,5-epimerase
VSPEGAEFQYKCTDYYAPQHERVLSWNDPAIGIDWPLVNGRAPTLAAKDSAGVLLKDAECFP